MQELRRHRRPVTARKLAVKLGVSQRTLYRDIATLNAEGAHIAGEAGTGYVLREGFFLPPLAFDDDEIDALVLGLRWVAHNTDEALADAAATVLAKISSVLNEPMRAALESDRMLAASDQRVPRASIDAGGLRDCIRQGRKMKIMYRDGRAKPSERTVWPIMLAFYNSVELVVAWCEMRQGFRHFRADRIASAQFLAERYPVRRGVLLAKWRQEEGHPEEM